VNGQALLGPLALGLLAAQLDGGAERDVVDGEGEGEGEDLRIGPEGGPLSTIPSEIASRADVQ
jgi:hypothetical protein